MGYPLKEDGQDNFEEVMTLSDGEVIFWNRMKLDPFFMYLDNSIEHVDPYWVELNRKVVNYELDSVKSNDEEIIERNGHDYANH